MTALQLTRVEQARLYTAMCTALGVPDHIETQRLAAYEARVHAFVYQHPSEFLEAYVLADTLDDHIHAIGVDLYAIKIDQVTELASCTTETAKRALGFLGLFPCPARARTYTNDLTGRAGVIETTPDTFADWRGLAW